MQSQLGKTIRILREAGGVSLTELARKTKLSKAFLSLVESGKRQPSLDVIRRISKVLGTPPEALVLMAMESTTKLSSTNSAANAIVRSVRSLIDLENKLSKLLGSEEDDQVLEDSPA